MFFATLAKLIESLLSDLTDAIALASLDAEKREKLMIGCLKQFTTIQFLGNWNSEFELPDISSQIRVGGAPELNQDWPVDANGKPMLFLARIKIDCEKPFEKLLFLSSSANTAREKSQSWYKFIEVAYSASSTTYSDNSDLLPEKELAATPVIDLNRMEELMLAKGSDSSDSEIVSQVVKDLHYLFKTFNSRVHSDEEALRELTGRYKLARSKGAFFANGISYSDARACDPHYSHLVEDSLGWLVLFQLRDNSIMKVTDNRDILFTIRYDDLLSGDFERGRLLLI